MTTDAAALYTLCRLDDIADGDIDGLDMKEGTYRPRHIRRQLTHIDAGKTPEQLDPALCSTCRL